MTAYKTAFLLLICLLAGVWSLADSLAPQPFTYFTFRAVFIQFSGVISIGVMSVALWLAIRPRIAERPLHGLDKMYRLHKWLGITALISGLSHWWIAKGTKWMVGWGWLTLPPRPERPEGKVISTLEGFVQSKRVLAENLGEWAFYIAVLLMILALIKTFPYRWFRQTHKWIALTYLMLAFHSAVLIKWDYWTQPVAWLNAALLSVGSISALLILLNRVGRNRRAEGSLTALNHYSGVNAVEGIVTLDEGWPGHKPGQFAFFNSHQKEGPHPYTIASVWDENTRNLRFIAKDLGDWTRGLKDRLKVGMPLTVEGPYGCFDFEDRQHRQIWIAAGIGITSFIARLEYLARHPDQTSVDLFHSTASLDAQAMQKLASDADAAGVRVHLINTAVDARLTPEQIRQQLPDWQQASIWFCGPARFGNQLQKDFVQHGLPRRHFHQELFEMR